MQSRSARLLQVFLYGVGSAVLVALLATLALLLTQHHVTRTTLATALGWGGVVLAFIAGAIPYSQNALGMSEAALRARLGEAYRPPPLPLAQILIPLIGAGLLFLAQMLLL